MRLQNMWPAAMLIALQASAAVPTCLKDTVDVTGPEIRLGDLLSSGAEQLGADVAGTRVGMAPRPGNVGRVGRADLERLILARSPSAQIRWCGAEQVVVRVAIDRVSGHEISRKVVGELARQLRPSYPNVVVRPDGEIPDVAIRTGAYALSVRPLGAGRPQARMLAWVDIMRRGAVVRSVAVPVAVSAQGRAWFAIHDLPVGAVLGKEDVEPRVTDLLAHDDVLAESEPVLGRRSALAVRAEQPLHTRDVARKDEVMLGDTVRVLAGTGAVRIEMTGIAANRAGQGQRVSVRTGNGNAVEGRVQGTGWVVVE
jgi:flagella basal body P-ring formation protein FlgA